MAIRLSVSLDTKNKEIRNKTLFSCSNWYVIHVIYLKLPGLKEKLPKETIENLELIFEYAFPLKKSKKTWKPEEIEKTFEPIKKALENIITDKKQIKKIAENNLFEDEPKIKEKIKGHLGYTENILNLADYAKKHKLKIDMSIG